MLGKSLLIILQLRINVSDFYTFENVFLEITNI